MFGVNPERTLDLQRKTSHNQLRCFITTYRAGGQKGVMKKNIKRVFDSLMPSLFGPKAIARLLILKTHLRIKRPILQFRLPHFHQSETELRMKLLH